MHAHRIYILSLDLRVARTLFVQVKGLMEALKMMYLSVSNEPAEEKAPDLPDDLSAEKMVTVVTIFFAAANKVVRETVEELLAEASHTDRHAYFIRAHSLQPKGCCTARLCDFAYFFHHA